MRVFLQGSWWAKPGVPAPKRVVDVFVAALTLILLLPVWCLIALAIWVESRGPILYSQEREGRHRRPFRMYKFRSMVADAEAMTGAVWAIDRDPRATRIGTVLRRIHLDEVPQLLNVLRGDMSVVGPRPERAVIASRLTAAIPGYAERLSVLPGITGLAQVKTGYDCSTASVKRKLRYDRHYVRRRGSLWLDLKIMAATCRLMCQQMFL